MSARSSSSSRTSRRAAAADLSAGPTPAGRTATAAGFVAVAVAIAVRLATVGVLAVAPDDAEYIGVGRRLWTLQVPSGIDRTLFTIRSWIWPMLVGGASHLWPGDPFSGPRVLGVALGLLAVLGAVELGRRLAGGVGALGVAAALLVTPVVWQVAVSTRVDVALLAGVTVTLLVASRPSPRRVVAAGVLAGLTMLVKETSAPLVLLPLAWLGTVPGRQWRSWAWRYLVPFGVTVAWWFVIVLVTRGELFPFQGVAQAERRAVPRTWTPDTGAKVLVAAWVIGAVALLAWRRRDVAVRVLVGGFVAMVPAAAVAWHQELAVRQFAPLAFLGAAVAGVAGAEAGRRLVQSLPRVWRRVGAASLATVAVLALAVPVGQVQVGGDERARRALDATIARWSDSEPTVRVASAFRFMPQLWARVGDHVAVEGLRFDNPRRLGAVAGLVWVDWRAGSFHALRRSELGRAVRGADALVITGRHRLGPIALARWLHLHGAEAGFSFRHAAGRLDALDWARWFRVRAPAVGMVPTLVTTTALGHLSDGALRSLGPITVAGPARAVESAAARVRSLRGARPTTLVVPL